MHPELKKCVALVSNGTRVQLRLVQGTGIFVSKSAYDNRSVNFLQGSTFVAEKDVRLITGLDPDEKSLYEFKLKSEMQYIRTLDFSLPTFRDEWTKLFFNRFKFFCEVVPRKYKMSSHRLQTGPLINVHGYLIMRVCSYWMKKRQ